MKRTPENVLAVRVEVDVKGNSIGCLELLDLSNKALVLGSITCCLACVENIRQLEPSFQNSDRISHPCRSRSKGL